MGSVSTPPENERPFDPKVSAPASYSGHHDHSFTLQAVMELQKSVSVLGAKIDNMDATLQSTKSKVEDLVNWKNRILGGAIVLGAIIALLSFLVTRFSDYVTVSTPAKTTIGSPGK